MDALPFPRRPLAVLLLTLTVSLPLLAGCFTATEPSPGDGATGPSPAVLAGAVVGPDGTTLPVYTEILHEITDVPMADGVLLNVDIWRPDVPASVQVPVVAVMSPYMGNEVTGYRKNGTIDNYPSDYGPYRFLRERLVPAGYALALVDLRGTRLSEGCIDLGGPKEQSDAFTIIEWLGTRNWSSGRVGMLGKSYDGLTALEAAALGAPHLTTVVVEAPVASWYQVQALNGLHYTAWAQTPGLYTAIDNSYVRGAGPDHFGWLKSLGAQPQCVGTNNGFNNEPTGDMVAYHLERDLRPRAANVTASVFWIHGLLDVNAKPDNFQDFFPDLTSPKKGYLWQAGHEWPSYEYEYPVENWTGRGDFWHTVHRWFDHWLLGIDNGMQGELNLQVQNQLGAWRNVTAWPPEGALPTDLHLSPSLLAAGAPAAATATMVDDARPEDAVNGQSLPMVPTVPRVDRPAGTFLEFATEPLASRLHVSGDPTLTVTFSSNRPTGQLVAHLYDVDANGTWHLVDKAALNLRHRLGVDYPKAYEPDSLESATLEFYPLDFVYQTGHRIGLRLLPSDVPWVRSAGAGATTTVHFGEGGSVLHLPVVTPAASEFWLTSWGENQVPYLGDVEGGSA